MIDTKKLQSYYSISSPKLKLIIQEHYRNFENSIIETVIDEMNGYKINEDEIING